MTDMYIDVDSAVALIVNKLPLIDDTDFVSREIAIVFDQAGMDLVWNFTTSAGVVTQTAVTPTETAGDYDWTNVGDAVYKIEMPASGGASISNDTEGYGYFSGICTGVLSWVSPIYTFRAAALNNALVDGGDVLDTNVTEWTATLGSDDNYPSTQSQLSGITNSGSAVNKPASSYTLTTGTQSANLYTDTEALNGTRHTHTDTAGVMSLVYHFLIGAGTPASAQVSGYVTGSNDDIDVYGYDHVTASYKQIGNMQGSSSTSNSVYSFDLFVNMVGTGADLGKVDIKFEKASGLSTATLAIDQIFAAYNQGAASTLDAIYFDSSVSNTNTVYGTDGIPGNPVSTEAAVNTLLASSGLHKIQSSTDSTITFATSHTNEVWNGEGWTLALGGQNISQTHIHHCNDVSGIATTPTGEAHILNSHLGALTIGACHITGGSFKSTFTAGAAGGYHIENATSGVAGSGAPTLTYSGLAAATTVNVRGWMGGGTWVFDSDCTASIEVLLGGTHTVTTGGGDIEFRGSPKALTVTTSGTGTTNIVLSNGAPIVVNGAAGTVNVYGLHGGITGTYSGSVTDYGVDVTDIPDILLDTAEIGTAGAGLTDLGGMSTGMKVEINAEMLDVWQTDTFAELAGVPAATSSLKDKLTWVFMLARNQIEQTATTTTVRADDTTTSVATSTVSDNGTTATRGELT